MNYTFVPEKELRTINGGGFIGKVITIFHKINQALNLIGKPIF